MTRDEALYKVKGYLTDIIPVENYSEVEEIINALKQESCEDCISRQDAIKTVCNAVCEYDVSHYPDCDQIKYCDEIQALISLPSTDAVEVVQCKDCKHWHREIRNGIEYFNFSSCDLNHYGDGHNFYCADAERRTDG